MEQEDIKALARCVADIIKRDIKPVYDKPLYTTREAAVFLGVKLCYIYELIRNNKLPYSRSKGGKLVYLRRDDLIKWATAVSVPALPSIRQQLQSKSKSNT